jgi:small nuclear ribonucleoprotein (snRNP)-like protein
MRVKRHNSSPTHIMQINYRMRATMDDGRQLAGQMLAFDKVMLALLISSNSANGLLKHMNLVLADTEEFRRVKSKAKKSAAPGMSVPPDVEVEEKRTLGLIIVRGTHVVSLTVEGPPPADPSARLGSSTSGASAPTLQAGPGISRPAGRGLPTGLTGPAVGVGGPAPPSFQPGFPPPGFPGRGGPPGSSESSLSRSSHKS